MNNPNQSADLNFMGHDPGAVKFGNFINYYSFHSTDERIQKLNLQMFPVIEKETVLCLDIGCNSGNLTAEFHKYLKKIYPNKAIQILAIDIDSNLIDRAKQDFHINNGITFCTMNIMTAKDQIKIKQHLVQLGQETFDITFCFSVTMWIHLNNGDDGLRSFIHFIKDISDTVIIESQPWACYRNAQRRIKKQGNNFPLYHTLKIKSEVNIMIENMITNCSHEKLYESESSSWNRRIQSFRKLIK